MDAVANERLRVGVILLIASIMKANEKNES